MTITLERPVTEPVCLKQTVKDIKTVLQVARGAALLDARMPGWECKVDLANLQMWSPYRCVLGQLYGHFYRSIPEAQDSSYGFFAEESLSVEENFVRYDVLAELWTQVILEKRAAVAA